MQISYLISCLIQLYLILARLTLCSDVFRDVFCKALLLIGLWESDTFKLNRIKLRSLFLWIVFSTNVPKAVICNFIIFTAILYYSFRYFVQIPIYKSIIFLYVFHVKLLTYLFLGCIVLMKVAFAIKWSGGKDQDGSEVLEWFERYVIPSKLDVSINQIELVIIKILGVSSAQDQILSFCL